MTAIRIDTKDFVQEIRLLAAQYQMREACLCEIKNEVNNVIEEVRLQMCGDAAF